MKGPEEDAGLAGKVATNSQDFPDRGDDGFLPGQAPGSGHAAGQIAFVRLHHMHAAAAEKIRSRIGCRSVLVTRGSRGMALFDSGRPPELIPVHGTDQVADVTGAGDTVIATFTLALAAGATPLEAALVANFAGGVVVMKMGTAVATPEELEDAIRSDRTILK